MEDRVDRPLRLVFVCTGNICRSPLAHAVFDHKARELAVDQYFETESAGTHGYHLGDNADSRMIDCARRHGLVLDHRANKMEQSWFEHYDLVLAMGQDHAAELRRLGGELYRDKVYLYRFFDPVLERGQAYNSNELPEVPDPYYGTRADFEEVWKIVERCTPPLIEFASRYQKGR